MLRGFYAICDVDQRQTDDPALERWIVGHTEVLLAAGPCMLQLRAKYARADLLWRLAKLLRPLATRAGVPFCVNDRLDVALAVAADAVHLGQDDLPLAAALAAIPKDRVLLVGVSTHNEAQVSAAIEGGADYIGFGPLFPTRSKLNPDPTVGLDRLKAVALAAKVPVVGIGGVNLQNVTDVAASGAAAAAVISAVANSADPVAAGKLVNAAFGVSNITRNGP